MSTPAPAKSSVAGVKGEEKEAGRRQRQTALHRPPPAAERRERSGSGESDEPMAGGAGTDEEELEDCELLEELWRKSPLGSDDAGVEVEEADGVLRRRIVGEEVRPVIVSRGQTIDAGLRTSPSRMCFPRVVVVDAVESMAERLPRRAATRFAARRRRAARRRCRTARPSKLEPMPPSERRRWHESCASGAGWRRQRGRSPSVTLSVSPGRMTARSVHGKHSRMVLRR